MNNNIPNGINRETGLPLHMMPQSLSLLDQIKAVAESVQDQGVGMVPMEGIHKILKYPDNASKLIGGGNIVIRFNQIPGFDFQQFCKIFSPLDKQEQHTQVANFLNGFFMAQSKKDGINYDFEIWHHSVDSAQITCSLMH